MQYKIKIKGQVQGVFYRTFVVEKASSLGILGNVRNCANGSVEVIARGPVEALKKLIGFCKEGNSGAKVESVSVVEEDEEEFLGFGIKY